MKLTKIAISLCLVSVLMFSCGNDSFSGLSVVAEKKGELIVCDPSLLNETLVLPLSMFAEELQMVKLDNADEALVGQSSVIISDNYILTGISNQMPYKLFDKKTGKFLNNIGAYGQGPGEYHMIYSQQIDEKNDRIYLLPWDARSILEYNLKGDFQGEIPLCNRIPKANFHVDTKAGTLIVSCLPFNRGMNASVWQQTVKGEMLKSLMPEHLAFNPTYNNEISSYRSADIYGYNVFTFEPRVDSIYHYDVNQNKLIPVFTMNFKTDKIPIHFYVETKNYFMGDFSEEKKLSETMTTTQNQRYYFVDKRSLKGSFFTIENDYLGGVPINKPIFVFAEDYYILNIEPGDLREKLEDILTKNDKMTPEMRTKLTKMKDSISDKDNNYVFYAKMK